MIDPSGLASFQENLAYRQNANSRVADQVTRMATGFAIGSSFARNMRPLGLGVGLFEAYRYGFNIPLLGVRGTLLGLVANSAAQSAFIFGAFTAGAWAGDYIGAAIDTYVDNNGGQCNALSGAGFGSH